MYTTLTTEYPNKQIYLHTVDKPCIKTQVGGSVHYGQNIANSRMMLPSHDIPYSDYYESGKDYDDVNRKGKHTTKTVAAKTL